MSSCWNSYETIIVILIISTFLYIKEQHQILFSNIKQILLTKYVNCWLFYNEKITNTSILQQCWLPSLNHVFYQKGKIGLTNKNKTIFLKTSQFI